jgi:hypothetical protein
MPGTTSPVKVVSQPRAASTGAPTRGRTREYTGATDWSKRHDDATLATEVNMASSDIGSHAPMEMPEGGRKSCTLRSYEAIAPTLDARSEGSW